MQIRHICIRCRHESGMVEIQGGDLFLDLLVPTGHPTMCLRCSGMVYPVKDDEVLPYEFVASKRRTLVAACWSGIKAPFVWWPFAFVVVLPYSGWAKAVLGWLLPFLAVAALMGFLLPWIQAWVANRQLVNDPHPAGEPPSGERATFSTIVFPVTVTTAMIFLFAVPAIAGNGVTLRGAFVRSLCGVFAGVILVGLSTRELFRRGRRPPPAGKEWRFGEEPK